VKEQYMNDWGSYQQYLRCKDTTRKYWVQWTGPTDEHKQWFYYRTNAYTHYRDVVRAGFSATTNAQPQEEQTNAQSTQLHSNQT